MALYDNFPYTNFHALNLDWIIGEMKKVVEDWEEFQAQFGTVTAEVHTGSPASVETTGDFQTGVNFDFTLPAGETGPQGPQGPQGPRGNDNLYTAQADLVNGSLIVQTDTGDFVSDNKSVIFVRFNDAVPVNANSYPVIVDSNDPHYLSVNEDTLTPLSEEIPAGSILAMSWTGDQYFTLLKDFGGSLPPSGVTAGTYGSFVTNTREINLPIITVNSQGLLTSATQSNIGRLVNVHQTSIPAGSTSVNSYLTIPTPYNIHVMLYTTSSEISDGYRIIPPTEYDVDFSGTRVKVTLHNVSTSVTYVITSGYFHYTVM